MPVSSASRRLDRRLHQVHARTARKIGRCPRPMTLVDHPTRARGDPCCRWQLLVCRRDVPEAAQPQPYFAASGTTKDSGGAAPYRVSEAIRERPSVPWNASAMLSHQDRARGAVEEIETPSPPPEAQSCLAALAIRPAAFEHMTFHMPRGRQGSSTCRHPMISPPRPYVPGPGDIPFRSTPMASTARSP